MTLNPKFLIASLAISTLLAGCAPLSPDANLHASGSPGAPPVVVPSSLVSSVDIAKYRAGFQAGFGDGYYEARTLESARSPANDKRYKTDPVFRLGYIAGHQRGMSEGGSFGGGGPPI